MTFKIGVEFITAHSRLEVFTAMKIQVTVFWVIWHTPQYGVIIRRTMTWIFQLFPFQ